MRWVQCSDAPWLDVSDSGHVRRNHPGRSTRPTDLKGHVENTGYYSISTNGGGRKQVRLFIHVLVCKAFHGERPSPKHHAAHRNGIKIDNHAQNLYWATPSENARDKVDAGVQVGETHPNVKLSVKDIASILTLKKLGLTGLQIGKMLGVNRNTVNRIYAGKARQQCLAKIAAGQHNPRLSANVTPLFAGAD